MNVHVMKTTHLIPITRFWNTIIIGITLVGLFISTPIFGQGKTYTVETVPDPKVRGTGYVSDPNAYLTVTEVVTLNKLIAQIEDSTTAQIAVVLLPSIGNESPKEFATELFAKWGIGQLHKDNGLLILSVMDQRRTEFETGYGMEGVLTDGLCYRIGMQDLVPHYKEDRYGDGLIATVKTIKNILENPEVFVDIYDSQSRQPYEGVIPGIPFWLEIYFALLVIFLLIILLQVSNAMNSKQDLHDKYLDVKKYKLLFFVFLFPLPYLFIYLILGRILDRLRNQPRYSKQNGKIMHKLSEAEEDAFLTKGQITEEEIKSVDYDVWVTDDHDDILILQYLRPFTKYITCPKCNFLTFYLSHSKVILAPTYSHSGKQEILHECKNCGHIQRKMQTIPSKQRSSGGGGGGGGGGGFSGGGGGGSSSWGGGSSGGGGAGVSW